MKILQTIRDFLKLSSINTFNPNSSTDTIDDLRVLVLNRYNEVVSILLSDISGGGSSQDLQSVLDIDNTAIDQIIALTSSTTENTLQLTESSIELNNDANKSINFDLETVNLNLSLDGDGINLSPDIGIILGSEGLTATIGKQMPQIANPTFLLAAKVNGIYIISTIDDILGLGSLIPTYADNAAAITGGLAVNKIYKTATGEIRVKV